jgi:uncharacterized protein YodC (DUF2158 family)
MAENEKIKPGDIVHLKSSSTVSSLEGSEVTCRWYRKAAGNTPGEFLEETFQSVCLQHPEPKE